MVCWMCRSETGTMAARESPSLSKHFFTVYIPWLWCGLAVNGVNNSTYARCWGAWMFWERVDRVAWGIAKMMCTQWWAWLMYAPLFLLFHYFLYIADPLLHTPPMQPPTQASTITHMQCAHLCFIGLASLIWWTYDVQFTCLQFPF